jgi:hypothetical protein
MDGTWKRDCSISVSTVLRSNSSNKAEFYMGRRWTTGALADEKRLD